MLHKANYRDPVLKPLDEEAPEDLIQLVETLVGDGIVKPQDVNNVLGQIHETKETALATIEDEEFMELERIKRDPTLYKKALVSDITDRMAPRFHENMNRHQSVKWNEVYKRLKGARIQDLSALHLMESTLGEPDVYSRYWDDEFIFCDFSSESPNLRRGLTYLQALKKAKKMGVKMMDAEKYHELEGVDKNSQSWIWSPIWFTLLGKAKLGVGSGWRVETVSKWHHDARLGFRSYIVI